ncbi:RHOMBOID-like protein 1 [Carex littledalei]|uniref:RHOMBOID-like protein n=1 Tax=Carex littledalei TaxID=544730 RepID=A0A833VMZ9_9POAL|nr:RHOMBOID-like protein 1 [Carex littledalei]
MGKRKGGDALPLHRKGDGVAPRGRSVEFRPFKRWFPWLVPLFVVANVALFVLTMYVNNCPKNESGLAKVEGVTSSSRCILRSELGRFSFQPIRQNPLLGPSSATLLKMGALALSNVVSGGQSWRMFTCIWLHGGVVHIFANMFSLILIGFRLEQEFGFVKIGMLYVISGIGGSLLSALFMQGSISVGASGALFGLLGSMLSELLTNWTIYDNKLAALFTLVIIIAINLAVGILPHVDNSAHIGGFISGFLLGFIILIRPQFSYINNKNAPLVYQAPTKRKYKIYQLILLIIASILLVLGFVVGLLVLFSGMNVSQKCSWCHYLSCIPTSKWSCSSSRSGTSCLSSQLGNQLNLTCEATNKMRTYNLQSPNATDTIYQLCVDLCS